MAERTAEQTAASMVEYLELQTVGPRVELTVERKARNLAAQTVDSLVDWMAALLVVQKVVLRAGSTVVMSDQHWAA